MSVKKVFDAVAMLDRLEVLSKTFNDSCYLVAADCQGGVALIHSTWKDRMPALQAILSAGGSIVGIVGIDRMDGNIMATVESASKEGTPDSDLEIAALNDVAEGLGKSCGAKSVASGDFSQQNQA